MSLRRAGRRLARVTLLTTAAMLAVVGTAWVHGKLKSSTPSAGAHLSAAPRALRLEFTERPEIAFTTVRLTGPNEQPVALGALARDTAAPMSVVAGITGELTHGTYRVDWKMAGADGHPIIGSYKFTIAPGASGLGAATVVDTPAVTPPAPTHHDPTSMPEGAGFNAESPVYVVIRWLQFVGLLIAIGAVAFRQVVLGLLRRKSHTPPPLLGEVSTRAARLGHWATWLLAGVVILRLLAQSYAMHGSASAFDPSEIAPMIARTTWGIGWLVQLAGVVLAGIGFHLARGKPSAWTLASVGAVLLAFSPALSGHAASVPRYTAFAVLADGIHVLGASGWLGSLSVMLLAGIPAARRLPEQERGAAVADVVNAYSPTALAFAAIAAVTGIVAAWLHLDAVSELWSTAYGQVLLLKLAILSVVALTGAYNWLKVRPTLGNDEGTRRVRRSATVEVSIAVLVLAVTAVLVATPPGMDDERMTTGTVTTSP